MKKIVAILIVFLGMSQFAEAQIKEGHIAYKIDLSSDNPEMQPMLDMFDGSLLDLYFNDLNSRVDMKMGSMMSTTTIIDLKTNKMLTLTSGMMGKNAIQGTIPEKEEMETDENPSEDFKINLTSETKQIIGLKAKKAIVTTDDGVSFDFWYTDEIGPDMKNQPMINKDGIPGILLEMVLNESGMKMSFTATSFVSKLPKKQTLFSLDVPEGYTIRSAEEMMKVPGM